MTEQELAGCFDHTFLKAWGTEADLEKLCADAASIGAAMVAIHPYWTSFCKDRLKESGVHVGACIGFPLGQNTLDVKEYETLDAIKNGADEIDYVINVGQAKEHNWDYIRKEMESLTKLCHDRDVLCKVIFETCYLDDEEIAEIARIAREVKPDFVKTSTGFGTGGATVEHVRLMKQNAGPDVKVKASGGIRSWKDAKAMLEAGAERLGTSASLQILEEFKASQEGEEAAPAENAEEAEETAPGSDY